MPDQNQNKNKTDNQNNYSTKHPDQTNDGQKTMQGQQGQPSKPSTSDQSQRKDAPQRGKDDNASSR
jgi:hypothetical protein